MEATKCIVYSMDGSKNEIDVNDSHTIHSLIYLLYKLDDKHIYTIYKAGNEYPVFTNTKLNTFEVDSETNSFSLFALKKEITEDIVNNFNTITWNQIIEQNNVQSIKQIFPLETFVIQVNQHYLTNLSPMCYMTNLQHLSLKNCNEISDLTPLETLYNLHRISINKCPKLLDIRPISRLPNLRRLDIIYCDQIVDNNCRMEFFKQDTSIHISRLCQARLRFLRLRLEKQNTYSRLMNDIGLSLSHMTNLTELYISDCHRLTDLSQFIALTNLNSLHITNCVNIENTDILRIMTTLTDLQIIDCVNPMTNN